MALTFWIYPINIHRITALNVIISVTLKLWKYMFTGTLWWYSVCIGLQIRTYFILHVYIHTYIGEGNINQGSLMPWL